MSIRVELELDDGSFTTRMIHAGETVQQFKDHVNGTITSVSRLSEASGGLLGTVRDLTVTLGMARAAFENLRAITTGWAGDIIKVNAEMEKLGFLLRGMSQAADPLKEAAAQIGFLRDAAKDAPFSLHALTDTFVKIKSTGIDPMKGAFVGLIDAVAAFGGTEQNLARAALAIQEMSGKGVVQTKELRRQLGQDIPRAVEIMSRALGVSQAELAAMMEHGTLEAKGAIAAFVGELERSFGGSALMQMRTWNGMLSQSNTLLQTLALTAGKAGFFDAAKSQLKDFNTMLASAGTNSFAESIGRGLATAVEALRSGLDYAIEFKAEIIKLGEALAIAFGAKAVSNGLLSIGSMLSSVRADMATTRIQWNGLSTAMAGTGGMIAGVRSLSDAFAASTLVVGGLARAIPLIASGLMMVASYAVPLVLVIGALAFSFGLLSDKEKDAYDNMVKFGAESRKQAEDAESYLKKQEEVLAVMERQKAAQTSAGSGDWMTDSPGADGGVSDSQITAQATKIAAIRENVGKGKIQAAEKEGAAMARIMQDNLDDETRFQSKAYDEAGVLRERAYVNDTKAARENHKDTESIQDSFRSANRAAAIKFYEDMDDLLEAHLRNSRLMQELGDKDAIVAGQKFDPAIIARQKANLEALDRVRAQSAKPELTEKPFDMDKAREKALAKIDELKAGTAGLRAEMNGASSEAAKLAYSINDALSKAKNMEPNDNAALHAITTELMKQQTIYDEMDRRKTGQDKMEQDVLRINLKLMQDIAALKSGGETNEVDKFRKSQSEGAYRGMSAHQQLQEKFGQIGSAAKTAGEDIKEAFLSTLTPIESVVQKLEEASKGLHSLHKGGTSGFNLPSASSGNALTDMIIGGESGARGNTSVKNKNSSAMGPAQFIDSTWMDFLKELHPEILKSANPLASRSDLGLSQEATGWYANKNAKQLGDNGIAANATNLNLAHFLGGAGATAALSRPDDTLVRTIPELHKAILANQAVFAKITNVADLKAWSAGRNSGTKPYYDGDSREAQGNGMSGAVRSADAENARLLHEKNALEARKKLTELEQQALDAIKAAREDDGGKLSSYAAGRKLISDGKGPNGKANTDPDAAEYATWLDYLKKKDAAEAESDAKKQSRTKAGQVETFNDSTHEMLLKKREDTENRLEEERKFKFSNEYYDAQRRHRLTAKVENEAVANGTRTQPEADARISASAGDMKLRANLEIENALKTEQVKTIAVEKSLMTVGEARDKTFQDDVRRNEQYLAMYQGSGADRVQVEAQVTRNITALRKEQFDLTPIGGMLKSWRDYSNNLQQASTGWMNTFNDKLADMVIHGRASWRGLVESIEKDLITIGLKAAESKLISGLLGMGTGGITLGGPNGPVPFGHNGMMVGGAPTFTRTMDLSVFTGAPRFHSGGFPGLDASEVPIIAKKGEQIGWPDQLAKQYGGGGGGSNFVMGDINVHGATNGSPSQNKDLAAQIAGHVQEAAKAMVGQELRLQMRPGGSIHAMMRG